jgi:hypothetical protein
MVFWLLGCRMPPLFEMHLRRILKFVWRIDHTHFESRIKLPYKLPHQTWLISSKRQMWHAYVTETEVGGRFEALPHACNALLGYRKRQGSGTSVLGANKLLHDRRNSGRLSIMPSMVWWKNLVFHSIKAAFFLHDQHFFFGFSL